jgi:hypothetical protein
MTGTNTVAYKDLLSKARRPIPRNAASHIPLLVEAATIQRLSPTNKDKARIDEKMKLFRKSTMRRVDKVVDLHARRYTLDYYEKNPESMPGCRRLNTVTIFALHSTMHMENLYERVQEADTTGVLALFEQALDAVMGNVTREYFLLPQDDVMNLYALNIDPLLRASLRSVGMTSEAIHPGQVYDTAKEELIRRIDVYAYRYFSSRQSQ